MAKLVIHRSGRPITPYLFLTAGLIFTLSVSYHLNTVAHVTGQELGTVYTSGRLVNQFPVLCRDANTGPRQG